MTSQNLNKGFYQQSKKTTLAGGFLMDDTYMTLRTFTWCIDTGAAQNTEIKTNTTRFGDGYEQVSSFGINNTRKSWQCSRTAFSPEINEIHDFLLEHNGVTPFIMTIDDETKTYRTEGDISKVHISGKAWQISFNIREVFVL